MTRLTVGLCLVYDDLTKDNGDAARSKLLYRYVWLTYIYITIKHVDVHWVFARQNN